MEQLIIKNFGPIKNIKINLTKVMVLIGPQGSGKSTIAKIITILRNVDFVLGNLPLPESFYGINEISKLSKEEVQFKSLLERYNIDSFISNKTEVTYKNNAYSFEYKNNEETFKLNPNHNLSKYLVEITKITDDYTFESIRIKQMKYVEVVDSLSEAIQQLKDEKDIIKKKKLVKKAEAINRKANLLKKETDLTIELVKDIANTIFKLTNYSVYIPAERVFVAQIASSLASFSKNNIPINKYILDFISEFESARKTIKTYKSNVLDITYTFDGQNDLVQLKNKSIVKLENTSSGTQALIPMALVLKNAISGDVGFSHVIEEPELNLFPIAQKKLVYDIVQNNVNIEYDSDLIVTTHSPYTLTCFNNLLYAYKVGKINEKETNKIINKKAWINPTIFSAYFINNGRIKKIMNASTNLINQNELDAASEIIMEDFDRLSLIQIQSSKQSNGLTSKKPTKL